MAPAATWEVQDAVGAAATGHVALPLIIEVGAGFGVLPKRTTTIEVEPATLDPSELLTPPVADSVGVATSLVRREVGRMRLLEQADAARRELDGAAQAGAALPPHSSMRLLRLLFCELERLDVDAQWGAAPAVAERLRYEIEGGQPVIDAGGHTSWPAAHALLRGMDAVIAAEMATA